MPLYHFICTSVHNHNSNIQHCSPILDCFANIHSHYRTFRRHFPSITLQLLSVPQCHYFPPFRAGAKLLHAMHMHTCLRHPSQATPCLTPCLTACLTSCLTHCLTPCLTPGLRSRLTSCLTAFHTSCLTPCLTPCLTACLTPDVCVTLLPHCIQCKCNPSQRTHCLTRVLHIV